MICTGMQEKSGRGEGGRKAKAERREGSQQGASRGRIGRGARKSGGSGAEAAAKAKAWQMAPAARAAVRSRGRKLNKVI